MAKRIYAKKSIRSFTLIEILVSLAIIGIVVALIIPGVQSVRCNAQVVKCISNLRQLGLSCIMYEQDYDALPGSLAEVMPYKKSRYAESSDHSLEYSFTIKLAHAQYLAPYYQNEKGILKCPAAPELEVGYALNSYVVGKSIKELQNMDLMLMADSSSDLISAVEHIDFRHCSKQRANAVTLRGVANTYSEERGWEIWIDPDEVPEEPWGGSWFFEAEPGFDDDNPPNRKGNPGETIESHSPDGDSRGFWVWVEDDEPPPGNEPPPEEEPVPEY